MTNRDKALTTIIIVAVLIMINILGFTVIKNEADIKEIKKELRK